MRRLRFPVDAFSVFQADVQGIPSAVQVVGNILTRLLFDGGQAEDRADDLGFGDLEAGNRVVADYEAALALFAFLAVAVRNHAAQPGTRLRAPVGPCHRPLADHFAFVGGEA